MNFEFLIEAILDSLKIFPILAIIFISLEYIEHKLSNKNTKRITRHPKLSIILGGLMGIIPQCGFSIAAADMYANKIISRGTLVAIFLSTSDEMLAVLLGENVKFTTIAFVVIFEVIVGILVGLLLDIKNKKKSNLPEQIEDFCKDEDCKCKNKGIIVSGLIHAFKTFGFVLAANIIIGLLIYIIGEERIKDLLSINEYLAYLFSGIVGLIPNCIGSVLITEMFASGFVSIGSLVSGTLTSTGLGILTLFRKNKNMKDNTFVVFIILISGVVFGFLADLVILLMI